MNTTKRLVVHGRVQGVGFRYAMVMVAGRLGVKGWVRNRRDGTVEATVQGPASAVDHIVNWARHGPEGASVSRVDIFDETGNNTYTDFALCPTV